MNKTIFFSATVAVGLLGSAWGVAAAEKVDFNKDIRPILELNCTKCHGPEQHKGKLRLDSKEAALKGGDNGPALVPGKPAESKMYASTILPPDHDDVMPPKKEGHLSQGQTDLIKNWIQAGADWPAGVTLAVIRKVDFEKDIQPILEFNCVACHRETYDKGGLRLETKALALKGGETGPGLVPGNKAKSLLYTAVSAASDDRPPGELDRSGRILAGRHYPDREKEGGGYRSERGIDRHGDSQINPLEAGRPFGSGDESLHQ